MISNAPNSDSNALEHKDVKKERMFDPKVTAVVLLSYAGMGWFCNEGIKKIMRDEEMFRTKLNEKTLINLAGENLKDSEGVYRIFRNKIALGEIEAGNIESSPEFLKFLEATKTIQVYTESLRDNPTLTNDEKGKKPKE